MRISQFADDSKDRDLPFTWTTCAHDAAPHEGRQRTVKAHHEVLDMNRLLPYGC